MSKLKRGDRVRFIGNDNEGCTGSRKGHIYIITKAPGDKDNPYRELYFADSASDGQRIQVFEERFELVTSSNESELERHHSNSSSGSAKLETELERLVRVANEGVKALGLLRKVYNTSVVFRPYAEREAASFEAIMQSCVPAVFSENIDCFHVAPKPKFEPFTVGSSWLVKLEGDTLHIGCKRYYTSKSFKEALQLASEVGYESKYGLTASRAGVKEPEGNQISWTDADKILAALEKAGI